MIKVKHVFILLLNKELYKIVWKHNDSTNLESSRPTLRLLILWDLLFVLGRCSSYRAQSYTILIWNLYSCWMGLFF